MSIQATALQIQAPFHVFRWLVANGDVVHAGQPIALVVDRDAEWLIGADQAGIIQLLIAEGAIAQSLEQCVSFTTNAPTIAQPEQHQLKRWTTPVARAVSHVHGLDLSHVHGSGIGGRISKHDVLALIEPRNHDQASDDGFCVAEQMGNALHADETVIHVAAPSMIKSVRQPEVQPFSVDQMERIAAINHVNATVPQAIVSLVLDMRHVDDQVERHAGDFARRGLELTSTAIIAAAITQVIGQHPELLRSWHDEHEFVQRAVLNLAIEHEAGSWLITNIKDLNLRGIARAMRQPAANGNATLSFVHSDASWWSAPTLGVHQSAVLHVGATHKQVVVREINGFDQAVIVPQAVFTLVYDTRLISDATAEQFLLRLGNVVRMRTED